MALEPSLWGTLPKELLDLIFVGLPIAKIVQLRVLSKEWKRNVDCKDSEFNQVLDATSHFNKFVFLYYLGYSDIYDEQANKWQIYEIDVLEKIATLGGADEGLVCFLSKYKWRNSEPAICYVMNPLTKQKMQLPPLLCMRSKEFNYLRTIVMMVKLIVNKKTKEYKVFVVGSSGSGYRGFLAQVFDSHIKEWTIVEATHGHIIGCTSHFSRFNDRHCPISVGVYNCANRTWKEFKETDIAPELKMEPNCCVLIDDHLFVLHKEATPRPTDLLEASVSIQPKYCISEFHLQENATNWVKLGVHSCGPCNCFHEKAPGTIKLGLWGCNGFLLVYGVESRHAWLYNLSTCRWLNLPACREPMNPIFMCKISWSAIA